MDNPNSVDNPFPTASDQHFRGVHNRRELPVEPVPPVDNRAAQNPAAKPFHRDARPSKARKKAPMEAAVTTSPAEEPPRRVVRYR